MDPQIVEHHPLQMSLTSELLPDLQELLGPHSSQIPPSEVSGFKHPLGRGGPPQTLVGLALDGAAALDAPFVLAV